jgi:hypothetical protein
MGEQKLDIEGQFLVKESKTINFIAGGVMVALFFGTMMFADYGWSNFLFSLFLFLVPGVVAIAKGRRNGTIIRINKNGFYHAGKLVTDWKLFYDAQFYDRMKVGRFSDNFVLDLRYYSSDYSLIYTRSIPLDNSQDKAEEEIIEAIQFYCNAGRMNVN